MKHTLLSLVIIVGFAHEMTAQLNDYKYIIVPKQFDGFKRENQYKTSTLVKYLFTEKGFNTVYADKLPDDLMANRCLGLFVNLLNESSMFTTKTTLILRNCSNEDILASAQGKSKKKEYEASFSEAITNAFKSFERIPYEYKPKTQDISSETVTVSFKNDVKKLEERPDLTKKRDPLVVQEATVDRQYYKDNRPVVSDLKKAGEATQKIVKSATIKEEQQPEGVKMPQVSNSPARVQTNLGVLYAQEMDNGYQLVDSSPKIRMRLFKSSSPKIYIAKSGAIDGVVYTESGKWFFEYYKANTLVTEALNIKF